MGCKYLAVWIWTAGYGFSMLMLLPPKKKRSAVEICMHVDAAVRRPLDSSEMHRQARAGAGQGEREREGEGEEPREAKLATHKIKGKRDKNPKGEKQKGQLRRRWATWTASASQFEGKMQIRGGRHRFGQAFAPFRQRKSWGTRCKR